MAGGVSANVRLRAALETKLGKEGAQVFYPAPKLCTDNGAMIAYAGALRLAGKADSADVEVRPRWPMTDLRAQRPHSGHRFHLGAQSHLGHRLL